jgi:hypothetical protein
MPGFRHPFSSGCGPPRPGTFLTPTERKRLAGFPEDIAHGNLTTSSTQTERDRVLIDTDQTDTNCLGAALPDCPSVPLNITHPPCCFSMISQAQARL